MAVDTRQRLTVLHGKFAKYLSWSQPFLYQLIRRLGEHTRGVIICSRTENLRRFPTPDVHTIDTRYLAEEPLALLTAAQVRTRWNPDVVHAHFGWSGLRMVPLRQFLRRPLVTTFGGADVGQHMNRPGHGPLYRTLLDASDRMVCVSESLRDRLVDAGADERRIDVIHRGTDLDRFSFVDRGNRSDSSPLQLLMVGRLVEKKGHRYALQALSELRRDGLRLHLTVVGSGPMASSLRRRAAELGIRDTVRFIGSTDDAGIAEEYSRADLLLHPSVTGADGDTEGLPNVIVEAEATGLPVVATRHGGIVEVVRHAETGWLVDERDSDGLAAGIRTLSDDRRRRLTMGRAAADFVRGNLGMDRQVKSYLELYRRLVEEYPETSPRMRQVFADNDYFAALRRSARDTGAGAEETIAGHLDAIRWGTSRRRDRPAFDAGVPWYLGRLRQLVVVIPGPLRSAARRSLRLVSRPRTEVGALRTDRRTADSPDPLRRSTIDFIRGGGSLKRIDPTWDVARLGRELAVDPNPADGGRESPVE